jgi:hypothetical protein
LTILWKTKNSRWNAIEWYTSVSILCLILSQGEYASYINKNTNALLDAIEEVVEKQTQRKIKYRFI